MRISIEVGHPAHVHYWRNLIRILSSNGHEIAVLARKKEITLQLLRAYGIPFDVVGESRPDLISKGLGVLVDDIRVLRATRKKKVEFMLSTGIPGSAHASRILGVPHVSLIDTEVATLGRYLSEPFSDLVCTPACFTGKINPAKHLRFRGYLELMYLHPHYFTADPSVLDALGAEPGEPLAVVRFSSWDSSHDVRPGTVLRSNEAKLQLLETLSRRFRTFVSSEVGLPREIQNMKLELPPEKFHDLLSFASLYVGEGATTASEAGVLGVPWIYVSKSPRSYLDEQASRYGLGKIVTSVSELLRLAEQWPNTEDRKSWRERRERLLSETIDVTAFMADLVERWPASRDGALTHDH